MRLLGTSQSGTQLFFLLPTTTITQATLRRDLLPFPIPKLPSPIHTQRRRNIHQLLCRKLRGKQPIPLDIPPIIPGKVRLDRPGVLRNTNRLIPRHALEVQIERPRGARDAGLARAIAVPAAHQVVGGGADAGGHAGPDGVGGQAVLVAQGRVGARQQRREVLHEQQRADGVDAEAVERPGGVDLRGGLLGHEDAGDGVGEAEVVGWGGEEVGGRGGGGGDGGFVWGGGVRTGRLGGNGGGWWGGKEEQGKYQSRRPPALSGGWHRRPSVH